MRHRIVEILEEELAGFGTPGASVAVVSAGEVVLTEGFGVQDLEAGTPATDSTLFTLASDTKCFSAAMILTLVEEGRLDLDAPVRDQLPDFRMADPRLTDLVNVTDLLAHRTGLPRYDYVGIGDGNALTNGEAAAAIAHLTPVRPFRAHFGYSNLHTQVAARVAEVITGQPFDDLLAERILEPLGATALQLYRRELVDGDFAQPYQRRENALVRLGHQSEHHGPNGGLVADARDMARWLLARLGHPVDGVTVLPRTLLARLHQPATVHPIPSPFPELNSLGYALCNNVTSYRGHRVQFHGGGALGHRSEVMVLPAEGIGISVQSNEAEVSFPMTVCLRILDALLDLPPTAWRERLLPPDWSVLPPREPGRGRPPSRDLSEYAGSYTHPAYGALTVSVVDGGLRASWHGLDDQLTLTHRDLDVWELLISDFYGHHIPIVFRGGADGSVVDLTGAFEVEVEPSVFNRVAG